MQLGTILDHVQRKIQDPSYERGTDLLNIVNMGLGEIASEVVLPYLYVHNKVACPPDSFFTSMPTDYYSNLIWAHNVTKDRRVTLYSSLNIFLEQFSGLNDGGDVENVCVHGDKLYYAPTPRNDPQEVRLWYSAPPILFAGYESEEIDWIPDYLQGPLLINYTVATVYEEIEEEQNSPNFNKYFKLYSMAKAKLINFVGLPESKPEFIPETDDWGA